MTLFYNSYFDERIWPLLPTTPPSSVQLLPNQEVELDLPASFEDPWLKPVPTEGAEADARAEAAAKVAAQAEADAAAAEAAAQAAETHEVTAAAEAEAASHPGFFVPEPTAESPEAPAADEPKE